MAYTPEELAALQQQVNAWSIPRIPRVDILAPLHAQVARQRDIWYERRIHHYVATQLFERAPVLSFLECMMLICARRRQMRRYLLRRFGFNSDRSRFLPGRGIITVEDIPLFALTCAEHDLCCRTYWAGLAAIHRARVQGQDLKKDFRTVMAQGVKAMLCVWQSRPLFEGMAMNIPDEATRSLATLSMAGWVRTRISTKEKKYRKANRLGHALCKERESLGEQATCKEDVLLERLAVTFPLAWHQDAWTTLPQLRKLIEREVLSDLQHRSRSKKHDREHLLEPPLNFSESMANDFVQQLEAEDAYRAWFHRAGLTAYEADILQLQLQEYSDKEIAQRLDRSVDAVKQAWRSARTKLQKAANS